MTVALSADSGQSAGAYTDSAVPCDCSRNLARIFPVLTTDHGTMGDGWPLQHIPCRILISIFWHFQVFPFLLEPSHISSHTEFEQSWNPIDDNANKTSMRQTHWIWPKRICRIK